MKHLARIIVGVPLSFVIGIPVSFVILIPFVGGVSNAGGFMVGSIVCTGGASLVVWIPVWFVLGAIVLGIFRKAGAIPKSENPPRPWTQSERDVRAVIDYMRLAEANGLSKGRIRVNLEQAGWGIAVIEEALKQLAQPTPDSQPHTG